MNIRILQLLEGAKRARGITVIIDVFRAFSVEAYLFGAGVEKIIPVDDLNRAYALKQQYPTALLFGERHGKKCDGFDYGNSPSEFAGVDFNGKTVIHTTSAGTQGLFGARGADVILGASLVNARATAEYIRRSGIKEVSLVCMGLEALRPTEEDTLCAEYIKSILENREMDIDTQMEDLRFTSGAKFFDTAQKDVFPQADFGLCARRDVFDFIMKFGADGVMRKEEI